MDGPTLQGTVDQLSGAILDLMQVRENLTRHLQGDRLVSLSAESESTVRVHCRITDVRNDLRALAAADLLAHIPQQDSPVPPPFVGTAHG